MMHAFQFFTNSQSIVCVSGVLSFSQKRAMLVVFHYCKGCFMLASERFQLTLTHLSCHSAIFQSGSNKINVVFATLNGIACI